MELSSLLSLLAKPVTTRGYVRVAAVFALGISHRRVAHTHSRSLRVLSGLFLLMVSCCKCAVLSDLSPSVLTQGHAGPPPFARKNPPNFPPNFLFQLLFCSISLINPFLDLRFGRVQGLRPSPGRSRELEPHPRSPTEHQPCPRFQREILCFHGIQAARRVKADVSLA